MGLGLCLFRPGQERMFIPPTLLYFVPTLDMEYKSRAYVQLHAAMVLFGLTSILGALISLPALAVVWWRVGLAGLGLWLMLRYLRQSLQLPNKEVRVFLAIGGLVGLHWLLFFGSIKLANASIGVICMATSALFSAFLEPWLLRTALRWRDAVLGLLIIPGMVLISHDLQVNQLWGVLVGLGSTLLFVLFSILNKKRMGTTPPMVITFWEMTGAWLTISLILIPYFIWSSVLTRWPNPKDWFYLAVLAFVCTNIGYILGLKALKHLTPFTVNLTFNLEPVYGILMAWWLLDEHKELQWTFYAGAMWIISLIFAHALLERKRNKHI